MKDWSGRSGAPYPVHLFLITPKQRRGQQVSARYGDVEPTDTGQAADFARSTLLSVPRELTKTMDRDEDSVVRDEPQRNVDQVETKNEPQTTRDILVGEAMVVGSSQIVQNKPNINLPEWMSPSSQLLSPTPLSDASIGRQLLPQQPGNSRVLDFSFLNKPPGTPAGPGEQPGRPLDFRPPITTPISTIDLWKKPTDTKPTDDKPTDSKPTDTKPTDNKPTNNKPATERPPTPERKEQERPSDKPFGAKREENGDLTVTYPDNRTRQIKFDADGRANTIITKDSTSTSTMVRKGNDWFMRVQGMELPMPGKVQVSPGGDVSMQIGDQGFYRKEKTDGTITQEKVNADGSRISMHKNNSIDTLVRKDGSSLTRSADGSTIVETGAGGSRPVTWRKQGDGSYSSDSQPAQTRKNFDIASNGTVSFDGPDGLKYVTGTDGAMMVQGEGQAKITLDDQNRIKRIEYPDGKKSRDLEYFDNSREIKKMTVLDKERNSTTSFERKEPGSNQWNTTGGVWNGDIKIGAGGAYSYKPEGSSVTQADKDGRWITQWPDGSTTRDKIGDDGSRLSYDAGGKLTKARAADGSSAEITENKITINNPRTGDKVTWTKSGDSWKSDSQRFPEAVKDLSVNEKCEVSFTRGDGNKISMLSDGSKQIHRKDGTRVEVDAQERVSKIIKGDQVRTFERQGNEITRVIDTNKDGSKIAFERRQGDGVSKVEMDQEGNLKIARLDGTSMIEKADRSRVELDRNGDPTRVVGAKGQTREYKYADVDGRKQLQQIVDSKQTSKGEQTEAWSRRPGTDTFTSPGKNGKEKVREGVQTVKDGNDIGAYKYKTADGKDRVAKPGADAGDGALSESVEEARDRFMETMREKLKEPNAKRMEEMIKGFEERMGDRLQMRKMAGLKSNEELDQWAEKTVAETYDKLTEMVSAPDGETFYDQKTRVKLAENFMFHAMDPTTSDQGPSGGSDKNGHGTCWIHSGHIWGMVQHPGAMADLLKQVSLKGEYTTKNSGESDSTPRTFKFSPDYLSFKQGTQETEWTIESATDQWKSGPGYKRQCDGDRSPVGKIFDYTIPLLGGWRSPGDLDGGMYENTKARDTNRYNVGTAELLYRITGDKPVDAPFKGGALINGVQHPKGHLLNGDMRLSLLEKGSVLTYTDGHLRSQHLRKIEGQWVVFQDDQHGELESRDNKDTIIGRISDINRWATGDRSAERAVTEKPKFKRWVGSGDEDAVGVVRPRQTGGGTEVAPPPRPRPNTNRTR